MAPHYKTSSINAARFLAVGRLDEAILFENIGQVFSGSLGRPSTSRRGKVYRENAKFLPKFGQFNHVLNTAIYI